MKTRSFQELKIWQKAHELTMEVYQKTADFPQSEIFGLTRQFQKAAVSIAANIAEGYGKLTVKDKIKYYSISMGSLQECLYYCILSNDLKYGDWKNVETGFEELALMLNSYIKQMKENRGFISPS